MLTRGARCVGWFAVREALHELGHEVDDREVVRAVRRYDKDGNGLLELAEFMQLAAEFGGPQASGPNSGWSDSEIRTAFRCFDDNRSGQLDHKELRAALRELGADVDEREAVRVLQSYDEDGNGLIDLREFSHLVRQLQRRRGSSSRPAHTEAQIRSVFRQHDTNRSGKLDYRQLRAALRDLGVHSEERDALRVLREYDRDGGGLLELSKFATLVRKLEGIGQAAPRLSRGARTWTDIEVSAAFQKYDDNSSGQLDYKELRAALQDLGLRHDSDEAVRVLQQYDRSGDGLLSLDEFGKLVRQLADGAAPSSSSTPGGRRPLPPPLPPLPLPPPPPQPRLPPADPARLQERGVLTLHLRKGVGLKAADLNGKSDPYVQCSVGEQTRTSKVVERTLEPNPKLTLSSSSCSSPNLNPNPNSSPSPNPNLSKVVEKTLEPVFNEELEFEGTLHELEP